MLRCLAHFPIKKKALGQRSVIMCVNKDGSVVIRQCYRTCALRQREALMRMVECRGDWFA